MPDRHSSLATPLHRGLPPLAHTGSIPADPAIEDAIRAVGEARQWHFVPIPGLGRTALGQLLGEAMPPHPSRIPGPPAAAIACVLRRRLRTRAWEQEASAATGALALMRGLERHGMAAAWLVATALPELTLKTALRDPALRALIGGVAEQGRLLGWVCVGSATPPRMAAA